MNRAMRRYVERVAGVELPVRLLADPRIAAAFAATPLVTPDEALVLPWTPNWKALPRRPLMDLTGYEAFVNHLHLDSLILDEADTPHLQLKLALMLGQQLATRLGDDNPVTVIVSVNGANATVRMHKTRPDERWVADDLEGYEEGILTIEEPSPRE